MTVLRAQAPWQVFEADRIMPLYGGRRFAPWTTIEGPAPVRRAGRYFCGYSGGNYTGAYGTGEVVADAPLGPYRDLRGRDGPIFGTTPGLVEGPGHFSVVQPDLVHDWIVLHGRRPGEPVRRVWLCPASWDDAGVTIGELTDRPQPAPPLPTDLSRFAGAAGPRPQGWTLAPDAWRLDADGLRYAGGPGAGLAWRESVTLTEDWVVEAYLGAPDSGAAAGGLIVRSDRAELAVRIETASGGRAVIAEADGGPRTVPLPTLGAESFDPRRFHAVEVRARSGRAEVRVDGVVLATALPIPPDPARLGLHAEGPVAFDAVALTRLKR